MLKQIMGHLQKGLHSILSDSPAELKKRAQGLIEDAKYYAGEVNKSTSVFDFTYSYQKFVETVKELIDLNEQKNISMYPPPRHELENVESNIEATIKNFIDRAMSEIMESGLGWDEVTLFLDEIEHDECFSSLLTNNNCKRIAQLRANAETAKSLGVPSGSILLGEDAHKAAEIVLKTGQASVSMVQRYEKWGYSRAARAIDSLEEAGIIGPFEGSRPRLILISKQEFERRVKIVPDTSESADTAINIEQIIQEENEWRRQQRGMDPIESELEKVDGMDGHAFENWCAELLKKNGFTDVEVTPGSRDQGVDVLAVKGGIYYAIQCKCYSSDLGNTPIQEVYAGKEMYNCQVGVVMTNRHFTAGAKRLAEKTRILLWDRNKLVELIERGK